MKKVIGGIELQNMIEQAIDLLCNTVKQTLGPRGNNVLIDHSNFAPFITNDGVTIAQNIESEEEGIATILEIAKESSIKTNEIVGDGTTTTLVLLQSLIKESLPFIRQGIQPIVLKRELNQVLEQILSFLKKRKRKPTPTMLKNIACISSNDEEIGALVFQSFHLVKEKSAIILQEDEGNATTLSHVTGYSFSTTLASPYFLKHQEAIHFNDALFIIVRGTLESLEDIYSLIQEGLERKRSFVLIANQFDESFVQEILSFVLEGKLQCCLLRLEEYGCQEQMILEDLNVITEGKIMEHLSVTNSISIGHVSHIEICNQTCRIDFQNNERIEQYIATLKKQFRTVTDDIQKEFFQKRIAMFTNGIIHLLIGAPTKTERREKRMRFEDAICAVSTSSHGILPGAGISLLQSCKVLSDESPASLIWKKTLEQPFLQILSNSGCDVTPILSTVLSSDYQKLYNVATMQFEPCSHTKVIDSYDVVIHSLIHACSIASMLLTTTSLVINEKKESVSTENSFTEW